MEAVQKTPEREAFYKKIDGENLSALWNVMGDLITPEPKSACRPHLWKFDAIRDYMTEAGKLIWKIPASAANRKSPPRCLPACRW
jgi:gentisate 1,2-dioxygenase